MWKSSCKIKKRNETRKNKKEQTIVKRLELERVVHWTNVMIIH